MKHTILILLSLLYISNIRATESSYSVNVHKKIDNITFGMLSTVYMDEDAYTEFSPYVRYKLNDNIKLGYRMNGISNYQLKQGDTLVNTEDTSHSFNLDIKL